MSITIQVERLHLLMFLKGLRAKLFSDCGSDSAGHDAGRTPSMLRFQQGIPGRSVDDIRNEQVPFPLMADAQ